MVIGVTGGLATGATTAAKYLANYFKGHLIDSDNLTHLILRNNIRAQKGIVSGFGRGILDSKGIINRARLADKVFKKRENLKRLCAIIHPIIFDEIKEEIKGICRNKPKALIIVDGPVLIESNFYKRCDILVLVASSLALQIERAKRFKHIQMKDAISRISLQMPLYEKARYADFIIDNNGGLKELRQNCNTAAEKIKKNNFYKRRVTWQKKRIIG